MEIQSYIISVGKTSIMNRFWSGYFFNITKPTVGADFKTKTIQKNNKLYTCQIWDTSGS